MKPPPYIGNRRAAPSGAADNSYSYTDDVAAGAAALASKSASDRPMCTGVTPRPFMTSAVL